MRLPPLVIGAASLLLAAPAAATGPTVTVVSKTPLVLKGAAFRPATIVTVKVSTTDGRRVRRVRTNAAGSFVARFAVSADPCDGARSATITTASGYELTLRLAPRGACAPLQPVDQ
jgi:hypothetical protein